MSKLELQAYRLAKRRFKMNRQKDLIKVNRIIFHHHHHWLNLCVGSLSWTSFNYSTYYSRSDMFEKVVSKCSSWSTSITKINYWISTSSKCTWSLYWSFWTGIFIVRTSSIYQFLLFSISMNQSNHNHYNVYDVKLLGKMIVLMLIVIFLQQLAGWLLSIHRCNMSQNVLLFNHYKMNQLFDYDKWSLLELVIEVNIFDFLFSEEFLL